MPALRSARKPAKRPRRRVLPRGLRLALRWGLPPLALAALGAAGAWLAVTGEGARLAAGVGAEAVRLAAHAGLAVDHVLVHGRKRLAPGAIRRALGVRRGMPILAFDPQAAKARLESLPWVRAATVERRLPDTIYVRLAEREPLALWQKDGRFALIDREGVVITREGLGRYRALPLVVGAEAAAHAESLLELLRAHPVVNDEVAAAIRVSARRWDLKFRNGIVARLPENGAAAAVATLEALIARDRILEREIVGIDLRIPGRLVVRMAPDAAAAPGKDPAPGGARRPRRGKDT